MDIDDWWRGGRDRHHHPQTNKQPPLYLLTPPAPPKKTNPKPQQVREALAIPFRWNPIVAFLTRFMTVFAAVIAVAKDLPDTEGDAQHGVRTFATVGGWVGAVFIYR